jgi:uncharacterized alkaline shock family protein YloU
MSGSLDLEDQEVGGFLVFNKNMVNNLIFKEDNSQENSSKLKVSMEIDIPYGVDIKRVAEDLRKLIGLLECEGDVILNDKDEGESSV